MRGSCSPVKAIKLANDKGDLKIEVSELAMNTRMQLATVDFQVWRWSRIQWANRSDRDEELLEEAHGDRMSQGWWVSLQLAIGHTANLGSLNARTGS